MGFSFSLACLFIQLFLEKFLNQKSSRRLANFTYVFSMVNAILITYKCNSYKYIFYKYK